MISIRVATSNTRGFLKNLFNIKSDNIKFFYEKNNLYEIPNNKKDIIYKILKLHIFDLFGVFQVLKKKDIVEDACFSYNRFLKTDKPYIIFLENPSALVNYCWERPKYYISKKRLKKCFNDKNLKAIVCMSKACYTNIWNLYDIPNNLNISQIYPLIPDDDTFTLKEINKISYSNIVQCLYISSNFELKGGRDILEVFERMKALHLPIHLTIITKVNTIREEDVLRIENLNTITVRDFNLNNEELNILYRKTNILLNPTRADSFSLVTLEALKYGCSILATNLYAIKEMVIDGFNGFITDSMIQVWDEDGTMNKYYRKHQDELLYSGRIDYCLVDWMSEKLAYLVRNREVLENFCINSLKLSRNNDFSSETILKEWEKLYTFIS